ncbi:MAG TPA: hypothetical protein VFD21_00040, partial [Vicinamibacterales bacterium]|nr:hypothetical protein [Vicinamibacterales bacterium]
MASRKEEEDPHYFCMPMGVPRSVPYPFRFVQNYTDKKPTHMFIIHEGNIHSYRQIFMDGRKHPAELDPTWFGHSIGSFEGGDTLVIDTVGFNEDAWMERWGMPHTDRLHTVERVTRPDVNTLTYEILVDDPGAYTAQWTSGYTKRWNADIEPFEYVCQENNFGPQLMIGVAGGDIRSSAIVP